MTRLTKQVYELSDAEKRDLTALIQAGKPLPERIRVPKGFGLQDVLVGVTPKQGELAQYEERWTGVYLFENEWQSFRTRQNRELELSTALHTYDRPGRYTVAGKVIDIFGNDTMTLVPIQVG